ncbi:MAG: DUF4334 domain-containing protein [Geminicoccaceae bacterium]
MPQDSSHDAAARLSELEAHGTTTADALAFFDSLPDASLESCIGRWRGSDLPSGHPLDGMLETLGWYGKDFVDAETVHPLLFAGPDGSPVALDPVPALAGQILRRPWLMRNPVSRAAFAAGRLLLRTREPRARLRRMEHRGVSTAAMAYDALPIIDVFRRVDADTMLGLMDLRGMPQPYFFVLRRVRP